MGETENLLLRCRVGSASYLDPRKGSVGGGASRTGGALGLVSSGLLAKMVILICNAVRGPVQNPTGDDGL